jgi:hypothetical protein
MTDSPSMKAGPASTTSASPYRVDRIWNPGKNGSTARRSPTRE